MKLGITLLENVILMAFHYGSVREPEFKSFSLKEKGDSPGWVWRASENEAFESFKRAERSVLALPAASTFLKRLQVDSRLSKEQPDYLKWLAKTQLPGDLSNFRYDFIPLRESFDSRSAEMLFYATPAKLVENLLQGLKTDFEAMPIALIPEQVGLVRVVERSLGKDDIAQAGIVNCENKGASAVYVKDGRFNHCRFFPSHEGLNSELSIEIETYFLSRADATESLPLVVTGFTGDFKTDWSPIVPAFMGIHYLEFAGAWGAADFLDPE
jgi:hypothetical protein